MILLVFVLCEQVGKTYDIWYLILNFDEIPVASAQNFPVVSPGDCHHVHYTAAGGW